MGHFPWQTVSHNQRVTLEACPPFFFCESLQCAMLPAPFFTAQGVIHAGLTLKRVRARMMPTLFSKFVASAQVELDDVAELLHSGRRLCLQENSVKDQTWPKEDIKISTYLNNQKKCIQHTYRPHISN